MPYTKVSIAEGLYTEGTKVDSAGRWIDGDHIRFVTDFPEKIGGWTKITIAQFLGACRSLLTWNSLENDKYIALGTNLKLYVYFEGNFYDITPYTTAGFLTNPFTTTNLSSSVNVLKTNHGLTTSDFAYFFNATAVGGLTINGMYAVASVVDANNFTITAVGTATSSATGGGLVTYYAALHLTNPFTTVNGSSIVTVHHVANGLIVGDFVTFSNATMVGGVTPNGTYTVSSIIDDDHYTITVVGTANANATGGGTVNYLYQINVGAVDAVIGLGYGVDTYGLSTYGTPRQNPVLLDLPRIWSLDIWGQDLIASPRDGAIYYWTHQNPVTGIAAPIVNAPAQNKRVLVWTDERIVVALGCTDATGVYQPMLVRWSDKEDYNQWTPTTTNKAGDQLLSDGNEIVAAVKMRGQILVATDTTLYTMYPDTEFVFAFRTVGDSRILSPNCMVEVNGIVYYMGEDQFYVYDGNLNVLRCEVRRHVFSNINLSQAFKVYGALNSSFNEVWWFYPSASSTENDRYVVYNYQKNIWYFGTMPRTAFIDIGEAIRNPVATSPDGYLYAHETGLDADGQPMNVFITSGAMQDAEGNRFTYVKNLVPNLVTINQNINFTMTVSRFPQSPSFDIGPYVITPTSDVIGTRAKGGTIQITYQNNTLGAEFQLGQTEALVLPVGVK